MGFQTLRVILSISSMLQERLQLGGAGDADMDGQRPTPARWMCCPVGHGLRVEGELRGQIAMAASVREAKSCFQARAWST